MSGRRGTRSPTPPRVKEWPLYITSRTVYAAKIVRIHEYGPEKVDVDVFIEDPVTGEELPFAPTFAGNLAQAEVGGYATILTEKSPANIALRQIVPKLNFEMRYHKTDTPIYFVKPQNAPSVMDTRTLARGGYTGTGRKGKQLAGIKPAKPVNVKEAKKRGRPSKREEYVEYNSTAVIQGFSLERQKERLRAKEKPWQEAEGDESARVSGADRASEL